MSDNWIVQNLENALKTWNDKLSEIWQLITQSPEQFKGGTIWNARRVALRISSGRIILNLQCWKICGFSSIAFSQGGFVPGNGISAKRRKKAPEGGTNSFRQSLRVCHLPQ